MKKGTFAILTAGILLGLNSCDSLVESIYDLDKAGEIEEVKKEVIEKAGDVLVYDLTLTSENELETSLNEIMVTTAEGAKEGGIDHKTYYLNDANEPFTSPVNDVFVESYGKKEAKKISEIDFSVIEKNFKAAKKQIPGEYINPALFEYEIDFEDGKRKDSFTINCVLKGEDEHMEGRSVVTDYYGFLFETDESGNVVFVPQD